MLRPDHIEIARFAPGAEEQVRVKFPGAITTILPAGDTLGLLETDGLRLHFHGVDVDVENDLKSLLSQRTEAIYVPTPISYAEAFDPDEEDRLHQRYGRPRVTEAERRNVQATIESLHEFAGVECAIPSTVMLARILIDHFKSTGECLLKNEAVWTTDRLVPNRYEEARHLVAGYLSEIREGKDMNSLHIGYVPSDFMGDRAGVFIVVLPQGLINLRNRIHLAKDKPGSA